MPKINYEGWVPILNTGDRERVFFSIIAEDGRQIPERAAKYARKAGIQDVMAVGLHNTKEDWDAVFTPSRPDHKFADSEI